MLSSEDAGEENWKSEARYAMEAGTYCVICGGPFDLEGDVYNLDPKEPRYQVRMLHTCQIRDTYDISGFMISVFWARVKISTTTE